MPLGFKLQAARPPLLPLGRPAGSGLDGLLPMATPKSVGYSVGVASADCAAKM